MKEELRSLIKKIEGNLKTITSNPFEDVNKEYNVGKQTAYTDVLHKLLILEKKMEAK